MSAPSRLAALSSLSVFTHRRPNAPPGRMRELKAAASAHLHEVFRRGASDEIAHCIAALGVLVDPSASLGDRHAAESVLRAHFESQADPETRLLQSAREQIRTLSARIAELELRAGLQ